MDPASTQPGTIQHLVATMKNPGLMDGPVNLGDLLGGLSLDPTKIADEMRGKKNGSSTPAGYVGPPSSVPTFQPGSSGGQLGADARSNLLQAMASRARGGGVASSGPAGPAGDPTVGAQPLPGGMGAMPQPGAGPAGGPPGGPPGALPGGGGAMPGGGPTGVPAGGSYGVLPGNMGAVQPAPSTRQDLMNRFRNIFAGA